MNRTFLIILTASVFTFTACATKQETGAVIGGATGAAIGSTIGDGSGQFIAGAIGLLIGAIVGEEIGRSIDVADERQAQEALEKNKTGQTTSWMNPDTGSEVSIEPTRTYQSKTGEYCREYTTDVIVGGNKEEAYGTACRQPDGSWKIVK